MDAPDFHIRIDVPDRPDHGCAFCGGRIPAEADDMLTMTLGDPGGRFAIVWCHRACLAARVVPRTAAQLVAIPAGDFLPSIIKRPGPDASGSPP